MDHNEDMQNIKVYITVGSAVDAFEDKIRKIKVWNKEA
jgi:hypothetical protein